MSPSEQIFFSYWYLNYYHIQMLQYLICLIQPKYMTPASDLLQTCSQSKKQSTDPYLKSKTRLLNPNIESQPMALLISWGNLVSCFWSATWSSTEASKTLQGTKRDELSRKTKFHAFSFTEYSSEFRWKYFPGCYPHFWTPFLKLFCTLILCEILDDISNP